MSKISPIVLVALSSNLSIIAEARAMAVTTHIADSLSWSKHSTDG
jgi:hypothetical protein